LIWITSQIWEYNRDLLPQRKHQHLGKKALTAEEGYFVFILEKSGHLQSVSFLFEGLIEELLRHQVGPVHVIIELQAWVSDVASVNQDVGDESSVFEDVTLECKVRIDLSRSLLVGAIITGGLASLFQLRYELVVSAHISSQNGGH